jgi:hypothetical protein
MKASTIAYLFLMGILFALGLLLLQQTVFGRLHVLDGPKRLNASDDSLPTELTLRHRAWGEQTVEDGTEVQRITTLLKQMKTMAKGTCPAGTATFNGTLRFLNGTTWTFSLGESMTLNGKCVAQRPSTQTTLKARFLNAYHEPEQLARQFAEAEVVTWYAGERSRPLTAREREDVKSRLTQAEPMTDYEEVGQSLDASQGQPRILKLQRFKNEQNTRANLMNITVYETLFSVQYMDDDNGNTFYLKGQLLPTGKEADR